MEFFSDLHIHSRFSRACSSQITINNLEKWAKIKGLNLLGTGDFTHQNWFKELNQLTEESGLLKTKTNFPFLWQVEISLMYSEGKSRKVHLIILAPSREIVLQINDYLKTKGRLDYDGRPIFNIPCPELTEKLMEISKDIEIIPAHAWTPWFGIFGSVTGFNSIKEAFKEKSKFIHSFETGMSSNPEMNWCLSELDKYAIVSFSDAHSFWPFRLGREATVFNVKNLNYKEIINSIRNKKIEFTIETLPSYGKYHYDGHRLCNFSCSPQKSKQLKNICPVCKKPLTIGVLNRVEELADRPKGFEPKDAVPFKSLIPLQELISYAYNVKQINSKTVFDVYNKLIQTFKNEFNVLLNITEEKLNNIIDKKITEIIIKNRENKLNVRPGYDGVYGKLTNEKEIPSQKSLTDF